MIITISGIPGAGKSTHAKLIAKKFKLKHYSTGDFMRELAVRRNVSLIELSHMAENDESIDKELDDRQKELGENDDNFIIDARIGWHFVLKSIKIFLTVSEEEGARRIYREKRHDEPDNINLEKTKQLVKERMKTEMKRYKKYYGINYLDKRHYDIVLETTNFSKADASKLLIEKIQEHL